MPATQPAGMLGKLAAVHSDRTLQMANYLTDALPGFPAHVNWGLKAATNWGMMGNDRLGDCVLPGSEIVAPGIEKAYRAHYSGPVIDLVTASGKRLSVTANHGVMTTRGFVRARFLRKGDHLVSSGRPEAVASRVDGHFDQVPSRAEDLFSSLRSGSILAPSKMSGAIDFHGDAVFFQDHIDVVNADCLLENRKRTALRQPESHFQLLSRASDSVSLHGPSALQARMKGVLGSPSSGMGSLSPGLSLFGRESVIAHQGSGGLASKWHASAAQPSADGLPADTKFVSQFRGGLAELVAGDELVDVGFRVWSGHVYDYSTQVHWYSANGIIVHNCTCAAIGHAIQAWTASTGKEVTIPDQAVLDAYAAITGWSPKLPGSDRGAVELDVLNYWRKNPVGGHQIAAYVATEPHNRDHVRAAVNLFGGLYIGLALPVSAQTQHVWSVPPGGFVGANAPGTWGGHAVFVVGYDAQGLKCVTWGRQQRMTWGFWDGVCDEAYALLSGELWAQPGHLSPSGFDFDALAKDLALL